MNRSLIGEFPPFFAILVCCKHRFVLHKIKT